MESTKHLSEEAALNFTYSLEDYPGWKLSERLPDTFAGPDGTQYTSEGAVLVDHIRRSSDASGSTVTVSLSHHPGIK